MLFLSLLNLRLNTNILTLNSAYAVGAARHQKAESMTPIPTFSPPEGNTTFVEGTTWCVARPGVSQADLQNALDWACGPGATDCSQVQPGGPCFQPDTLLSHASFAFNSYYQQNGNSDIACNFGGTAAITSKDPSKMLSIDTFVIWPDPLNPKLNQLYVVITCWLIIVDGLTGYGSCSYLTSEWVTFLHVANILFFSIIRQMCYVFFNCYCLEFLWTNLIWLIQALFCVALAPKNFSVENMGQFDHLVLEIWPLMFLLKRNFW